jgi:hypothetical protein
MSGPRNSRHVMTCAVLAAFVSTSSFALAKPPEEPPVAPPEAEPSPPEPSAPVEPEPAETKQSPRRSEPFGERGPDWDPPKPPSWDARPDGPARLPYRDGKPVPKGYSLDTVPRRGMIAAGGTMAGSLHLISMIAAIALDAEADEVISDEQGGRRSDPEFSNRYTPLFIPLVGPFIAVKTADANGTGSAILIMNGIAQVTGASLVISGLVATKQELVRDDPLLGMTVVPLVTEGGGGVALQGAF